MSGGLVGRLLSGLARTRRVPSRGWKVLSSKDKRDLNKGKRVMKAGFLDEYGNFRAVPSMAPVYMVPDLTNFQLKPYAANPPLEAKQHKRQ